MQGSERPLKGFLLSCIAFFTAGRGVSSVSLRLTAPSAEGAFWGSRVCGRRGDFASAEARRGTEPVWQLSDRPRRPFGALTL